MRDLAAKPAVQVLLLGLFCLALYWPGERSIPAIDRDEARYAEASSQMAKTGDYVDIRFQDEVRYKKPAGIYWLQTAAVDLLGEDPANPIWPYRLPSLIGTIAAVLATFLLVRDMAGAKAALPAAGLLAASLLLNAEARLATPDAMLLASVTVAFAALWRIRQNQSGWHAPLVFWLAIAAGILLKGPLIVVLVGLAVVALSVKDGRAAWLKALQPYWGIPLVCTVVAPWLVLVGLKSQGAFFSESLGHDFAAKLIGGQEAHGGLPGLYLLEFPLAFWPGSLLAMLAVPAIWRHRRDEKIFFLLAWLVPNWLLFEAVPTKLPHYVLPLFPAIAVLTVLGLEKTFLVPRLAGWIGGVLYAVATLALAGVIALALPEIGGTIGAPACALPLGFAAGAGAIVLGFYLSLRKRSSGPQDRTGERDLVNSPPYPALSPAGGEGKITFPHHIKLYPAAVLLLAVYSIAFGLVIPCLGPPFVARLIVEQRQAYALDVQQGAVALVGFHEPSAVLGLGRDIILGNAEDAALALDDGTAILAYIADDDATFQIAAQHLGLKTKLIDHVDGFNYTRGKPVHLAVYRRIPPPPEGEEGRVRGQSPDGNR